MQQQMVELPDVDDDERIQNNNEKDDDAILKDAAESICRFFSCAQVPCTTSCTTSSCSMKLLVVDLQSIIQEVLGGALDEIRTAVSLSLPSTNQEEQIIGDAVMIPLTHMTDQPK